MTFSARPGVHGPRAIAIFAALSMLLALIPTFFSQLPADASPATDGNPDLVVTSCGLDVLFVIDETGSMNDNTGQENDLENAYIAFATALDSTASKLAVIEFSSYPEVYNTADPVVGGPDSARRVTNDYVDPGTIIGYPGGSGVATSTSSYQPGGYTNWQEALWEASLFSDDNGYPDLLIFFTDGNPNSVDGSGFGTTDNDVAALAAKPHADSLKSHGVHMLGIGLGLADGSSSETRLSSVTGDEQGSAGSFDIVHDDYILLSDSDEIAGALDEISDQLCNTTINITKWVPESPDYSFSGGSGSGFIKDDGWVFDVTLDHDNFEWVTGKTPPGSTSDGSVQFQYSLDTRGDTADATITEELQSGYGLLGGNCVTTPLNGTAGSPVPFGSNGWTVQDIPDRATVDCDVYNEAAFLTLTKTFGDKAGSDVGPADFTVGVQGGFSGPANQGPTMIPAGEYTIQETNLDTSQWTPEGWVCSDGVITGSTTNTSAVITLNPGDVVTCTVTNTAIAPQLTLKKTVKNDDGGTAKDSNFTLFADGPTPIEGKEGDTAVTGANVDVGVYNLSEAADLAFAGLYTEAGWECTVNDGNPVAGTTVTLDLGDVATCEVTNEDSPPGLTMYKNVTNAWGGPLGPGAFTLTVSDGQQIVSLSSGESLEDALAGIEYTVGESEKAGYVLDKIVCGAVETNKVTLELGENVSCTVYNKDVPGSITVTKLFADNSTGSVEDFDLLIDGDEVASGEKNLVAVGTYEVTEGDLPEGWVQKDVVCYMGPDEVGSPILGGIEVSISLNQHVDCYITNGELPTVTVGKIAVGEDEATFDFTGDLGAFEFDENGGSKSFTVKPGQYEVVETPAEFWALTDISCDTGSDLGAATGFFDVTYGDHETCTFTNEQLQKSITVVTEGVCVDDAPYLKWTVNPVNFNGTSVDITWSDLDPQDPLYKSLGNPLQGMMLWPGTEVDQFGKAIDWAGWVFENGAWALGDDGFQGTRPTASVKFDVNPSVTEVVAYPGGVTEPTCDGPPAEIIVKKTVVGGSPLDVAPFEFEFATVGFDLVDNTLGHGQESTSGPLTPGNGYSVTEILPAGWLDYQASCDDASDPSDIDLSVGEVVTCTFTNEIQPEVRASVLVAVEGACVLTDAKGSGEITVTVSVDNGASVAIKSGATTIDTLSADGVVEVAEGQTYSWEATPNAGFEFPGGFVSSGLIEIETCTEVLPFTGIFADEMLFLATILTIGGALVLIATRKRGRHEA